MKKSVKVLSASLLFLMTPYLFASSVYTCNDKVKLIERKIEYAKAYNNPYKVRGLEIKLAKLKTYCTDDGLALKYQKEVYEKQADVYERQAELREAQIKGKMSKIAKKEAKLREAQFELEMAKKELAHFNNVIN